MKEYYYLDATRTPVGPLSLEELIRMHTDGTLGGDVLVAPVGGDKWKPLSLFTQEGRNAAVGPCPRCGSELALSDGEVPELCPACGKRLRPKEFKFGSCVYSALAQYASFSGRATRAEYWWFYLFTVIISAPLSILYNIMDASDTLHSRALSPDTLGVAIIYFLVSAGTILPSLAVGVRRLHDVGRSGWWFALIPTLYIGALILIALGISFSRNGSISGICFVLGILFFLSLLTLAITIFVWLVSDSHRGTNKYGPSTKYPL